MSKRTFYYWISGSVSQESLFLVIHLSIAGPMHRNGRRVSVWTEEDEGDLIWMDTHSSLSVIRSFSLQANDTNWHFVDSRVLSLENSMCGWSTADMLWHGHVFVLCPPLTYYYHRVSSWGGLRRRIWRAHFTLTRHSVDLIHICLTFHEFDAMQTWRQFFYVYPHGLQCLPMLLLLDHPWNCNGVSRFSE